MLLFKLLEIYVEIRLIMARNYGGLLLFNRRKLQSLFFYSTCFNLRKTYRDEFVEKCDANEQKCRQPIALFLNIFRAIVSNWFCFNNQRGTEPAKLFFLS